MRRAGTLTGAMPLWTQAHRPVPQERPGTRPPKCQRKVALMLRMRKAARRTGVDRPRTRPPPPAGPHAEREGDLPAPSLASDARRRQTWAARSPQFANAITKAQWPLKAAASATQRNSHSRGGTSLPREVDPRDRHIPHSGTCRVPAFRRSNSRRPQAGSYP